jgi:Flp pilus assembly protein TadD
MGVIGCIWLAARRKGHALLSALAYPAIGLLLVTLMLAYSRGALAALVLGLALWFAVVPLRLRGAAVLLVGAVAAGLVVAWDFAQSALSSDSVALHARVVAGRQLGALLLAMLVVLAIAGVAIGFSSGRRAPSRVARRRAGAVLLSILVLAVVAFAGALAVSHRGLTGSISHGFNTLTNTHAPVPAETPGRLTAIGSVRAVYWNEALKVFQAHPALGAGARSYGTASLRYRSEDLEANDAHGFVVQTLADLGLVGLAIMLALLFTWIAAAGRATHPFNRRWTSWRELKLGGWQSLGWRPLEDRGELGEQRTYSPERVGMLSMLCLVVVFGIHSTVDWTWFVPGDACVALLCAGWLAGRGPLAATAVEGPQKLRLPPLRELGPLRVSIASAAVIAALLAAWAQWQPQRSADASQEALSLSATDSDAALTAAQNAVDYDPVSAEALFTLSTIQQHAGQSALARATLVRAVRLQPSNPQTWKALGEYDLQNGRPADALNELRATVYLNPLAVAPLSEIQYDPELLAIQNAYIEALRESMLAHAVTRVPKAHRQAFTRSKTASVGRSPAAAAARRAALRRRALERLGSRNPRAVR